MSVRIVEFADLPSRLEPEAVALDVVDGDPPHGRADLLRARRLGHPFAPYVGVYAVEDDRVLSRVEVLRRDLTTDEGRVRFSGITSVVTRPDAGRRGLAGRLLREVHRRERSEGLTWSLLWTHRSWGAHRLYERLGYRDLLSLPTAIRRGGDGPSAQRHGGYRLRRARSSDARLLESLFDRSVVGRLGFSHRPRGMLRVRFALGWRRPGDHYLLLRGSRAVGYYNAAESERNVGVREAVTVDPADRSILLDMVERRARSRWVSFETTTFVRDELAEFRSRGYTVWPSSHAVLMGRPIDPRGRRNGPVVARTFEDPRVTCQRGDIF